MARVSEKTYIERKNVAITQVELFKLNKTQLQKNKRF